MNRTAPLPLVKSERTTRVLAALPTIEASRRADASCITLWEPVDASRKLAGDAVDRAMVVPEARALLSSFDDVARHFELPYDAPCS
jgi:hypothetical protein